MRGSATLIEAEPRLAYHPLLPPLLHPVPAPYPSLAKGRLQTFRCISPAHTPPVWVLLRGGMRPRKRRSAIFERFWSEKIHTSHSPTERTAISQDMLGIRAQCT